MRIPILRSLLAVFSAAVLLTIGCPTETDGGGTDAGGTDAGGETDGGNSDAGPGDAGPDDGGVGDAGPGDGGAGDAGAPDGGTMDAGGGDGGSSVCAPDLRRCQDQIALTCRSDGSGWDARNCTSTNEICTGGVCAACAAGETRCAGGSNLQTCDPTGSAWIDSTCAVGLCDASTGQCPPFSCTPGAPLCQADTLNTCNATGDGFDLVTDCSSTGTICRVDRCVDACVDAAASGSTLGCEFWPVALSNALLGARLQPEFAVVLVNPVAGSSATVEIFSPASATPIATVQVLGGSHEIVRLPWNSLATATPGGPVSTRGTIAYRVVSSRPLAAYQFNPLSASLPSGCTQDADCPGYNSFVSGSGCLPGPDPRTCGLDDYALTMDASLLLPVHGLTESGGGSAYLALTSPHQTWSHVSGQGDMPAYLAIVATRDATTVTFTSGGASAAGGGTAALDPGEQATISLDAGEVLQFASRQFGTPDERTNVLSGVTLARFPASDLTSSVITSDRPVAVFSGGDCTFVPYDSQACDHLEEQLVPFSRWGDRYVAARSAYPNNTTIGDWWRVVAGADGTQLTFTPTSVQGPTTLQRGEFVEFLATADFVVQSQDLDHPIQVAQYHVGIQAIIGTSGDAYDKTNLGDPAMLLAVPTEQYRNAHTFFATEAVARSFVTVVRPAAASVQLDGAPMNATWDPIAGTTWEVGRLEIAGGSHQLRADQPVGLSIHGFDWSTSYGYPGGLDLDPIVTVGPGG